MWRDEVTVQNFAGLLVDEREQRGLPQARLAVRMGISPSYLNVVEKGKRRPPVDAWLIRWAVALGMNDEEISGFLDLGKGARFAWQRWTRACRLEGLRRDQTAAYDYLESLIASAAELGILVSRRGVAPALPRLAAQSFAEERHGRPSRGTLVIEAAYMPLKETAM